MGKEKAAPVAENALARKALEAVEEIDNEAQRKKEVQLLELRKAKDAIELRITELIKQQEQLDVAIGKITGRPHKAPGTKRNLGEIRERLVRWLSGHVGTGYTGEQLVKDFPELKGTAVSTVLKPAIDAGQIIIDATRGRRHQTYTAK